MTLCKYKKHNNCPNILYFFYSDHIGSSTYLTDEAGNPYQFILHLPFGDDRLVALLRQSSDKDHSIRREPIAPAIGLKKTRFEK